MVSISGVAALELNSDMGRAGTASDGKAHLYKISQSCKDTLQVLIAVAELQTPLTRDDQVARDDN